MSEDFDSTDLDADLSMANDARKRREVCSQRSSRKSIEANSSVSEEQLAMQNHWSRVLVAWCNVGPDDNEADDTAIVIPTSGVTEQWINLQKSILENKGYSVTLSTSSFRVALS